MRFLIHLRSKHCHFEHTIIVYLSTVTDLVVVVVQHGHAAAAARQLRHRGRPEDSGLDGLQVVLTASGIF